MENVINTGAGQLILHIGESGLVYYVSTIVVTDEGREVLEL